MFLRDTFGFHGDKQMVTALFIRLWIKYLRTAF